MSLYDIRVKLNRIFFPRCLWVRYIGPHSVNLHQVSWACPSSRLIQARDGGWRATPLKDLQPVRRPRPSLPPVPLIILLIVTAPDIGLGVVVGQKKKK